MENLDIRPLNIATEEIPYNLLFLADPSKEAIDDYLGRGFCYIAYLNEEIIGEYVLLPTRPFTIELVNLAIDQKYQGKGYSKKLVYHSIEVAKDMNYKTMELGTGNSGIMQLALYQKCGFTITHVDFDFFRRHYPEPIFEFDDWIECRHMIRLKMNLI